MQIKVEANYVVGFQFSAGFEKDLAFFCPALLVSVLLDVCFVKILLISKLRDSSVVNAVLQFFQFVIRCIIRRGD